MFLLNSLVAMPLCYVHILGNRMSLWIWFWPRACVRAVLEGGVPARLGGDKIILASRSSPTLQHQQTQS